MPSQTITVNVPLLVLSSAFLLAMNTKPPTQAVRTVAKQQETRYSGGKPLRLAMEELVQVVQEGGLVTDLTLCYDAACVVVKRLQFACQSQVGHMLEVG